MTDYSDFIPEVLPYTRDMPDVTIIAAVRNTCIEFCHRTQWWQYEHADITAIAEVSDYDLDLPDEAQLDQVVQAFYADRILQPTTPDILAASNGLWVTGGEDWRVRTGDPRAITQIETASVRLYPTPETIDSTSILKLVVSLKPTRDSTGVLDDVFDQFAEVISFGARARLYEQPGAPCYDIAGSQHFRNRFRHECSMVARTKSRAQGRVTQVLRPPQFI